MNYIVILVKIHAYMHVPIHTYKRLETVSAQIFSEPYVSAVVPHYLYNIR